jgi:hypothetical protein
MRYLKWQTSIQSSCNRAKHDGPECHVECAICCQLVSTRITAYVAASHMVCWKMKSLVSGAFSRLTPGVLSSSCFDCAMMLRRPVAEFRILIALYNDVACT